MYNNIHNPVSKKKLTRELTHDKLLRLTSKGANEVYSFSMHEAPETMYEIARLREVSFRAVGSGTGKIMDIDDFDINPPAYKQLIVWNPREQEIIGGYRYAKCSDYITDIQRLSMTHYFRFSPTFINHYLPYSIELGRAWVNPAYQPSNDNRKSIFALDNLWDGIGAVICQHSHIRYLYGKLTIPQNYHWLARIMMQWLLNHYYKDNKNLITPASPVTSPEILSITGIKLKGNDFKSDFKLISKYVRSLGLTIPPLVSAYTGLAKKLTAFGTTVNPELNNSFETGIMIQIDDIYPDKFKRYIKSDEQKELAYS